MFLEYEPIYQDFLIPMVWLYTEMHYRFNFLPISRYFKREAEILADIPHRIGPGEPIPLLILVKDADTYPLELSWVDVTLETDGKILTSETITIDETVESRWWHRVVSIPRPAASGEIRIWVLLNYRSRGKLRQCLNHNLRGLSPQPMHVYLAAEGLPGRDVIWGDIHHHTSLTEDFVEFGAPLDATRIAARAAGLDFVCTTDHSYDLDDTPGDWRTSDPLLTKWHNSRREINRLNECDEPGALLLPSEEVSIRNSVDRNIHALVLNHPEYLPGSGDSAERWLSRASELDIDSLVERLGPGGVVIAGHPYNTVPMLQWLLLNRGVWEDRDILHPEVCGMQILNGRLDEGFFRGVKEWTRFLLSGERQFIFGGSDAHGNFNMHRQIRIPMVSLHERQENILGYCRTGVLGGANADTSAILKGLKDGSCIITNGPFLDMVLTNGERSASIGGQLHATEVEVEIHFSSTPEFGPLAGFRLIHGRIGDMKEEVLHELAFESDTYQEDWHGNFTLEEGRAYFRAEVETRKKTGSDTDKLMRYRLAMTNPIWVEN